MASPMLSKLGLPIKIIIREAPTSCWFEVLMSRERLNQEGWSQRPSILTSRQSQKSAFFLKEVFIKKKVQLFIAFDEFINIFFIFNTIVKIT